MSRAIACHAPNMKWIHAAAATAFLMVSIHTVAPMAQGLDTEKAIDTIVGSDIKMREEKAATDRKRLTRAIEHTSDNITKVRKTFALDTLNIVFLPDLAKQKALAAKLEEHSASVQELREAIESNAMFFHAVNSKGAQLRDIVALEFGKNGSATVFVAGNSTE